MCTLLYCQPLTIWEMTEDTSMSVGSCFTILTENLGMCCASAAEHLQRPTETNWTDWERMLWNYYGWCDEGLWVWCRIKSTSFTGEIKSSIKEINVCADEICSLWSLFSSIVKIWYITHFFLEVKLWILNSTRPFYSMWEAAQNKQLEHWWEHTWYSPGIFPAEFLLFPKLKVNFKGHQFESVGEIKKKNATAPTSNFFKSYVECWDK